MNDSGYPPRVGPGDEVVLFDGVCRLCNFSTRFLMRFDTERRYKLAAVQSEAGQDILRWFGLPTDHHDTFVLVRGNKAYYRSAAAVRVMAGLPLPWKLVALAWIIPRPIRDWLYDRIAQNRYRLFGKYDTCTVPTPENLARFLDYPAA